MRVDGLQYCIVGLRFEIYRRILYKGTYHHTQPYYSKTHNYQCSCQYLRRPRVGVTLAFSNCIYTQLHIIESWNTQWLCTPLRYVPLKFVVGKLLANPSQFQSVLTITVVSMWNSTKMNFSYGGMSAGGSFTSKHYLYIQSSSSENGWLSGNISEVSMQMFVCLEHRNWQSSNNAFSVWM